MGTISIGDYGSCYLSPISGTLKGSILRILSNSDNEEAKEGLLTSFPPAIVMKIFNTLQVSDERKMDYLKRWHCHLPYPRVPYKVFYRKAILEGDLEFQRLVEKKIYFVAGIATPKSEVVRRKLKAEVSTPGLIDKQARAYIKGTALKQLSKPEDYRFVGRFFKPWNPRTVRIDKIKKNIDTGLDLHRTILYRYYSPWERATEWRNLEVISSFIQAGANVNEQFSCGKTALFHVARKGDLELVKMLINAGANVNCISPSTLPNRGGTPAMIATFYGHDKILQELIHAGADLEIHYHGQTVLSIAIDRTVGGFGARLSTLRVICDSGVNLNSQHQKGKTPLMELAEKNFNVEALDILIEAGANLDMQDHYKKTAVMHALIEFNYHNALTLVQAGANVDLQDRYGKTVLMFGALNIGFNQDTENDLANALIASSENLDLQDRFGKTALMHAGNFGNRKYVRLLLKAGARVDLKDQHGKTVMDCADPAIKTLIQSMSATKKRERDEESNDDDHKIQREE